MNLKRRLRALERVVAPSSDRCEACGYAPGAQLQFTVSHADEESDGPDLCPECGRPLIIRLTFDDPLETGHM